jgi:hypothetical protein
MTVRSRSLLAGAMLAVGLATAGPASADLVPLPPLPPLPVGTTCLSTTTVDGILQCTVTTVGGTVTTITTTTQGLVPGTSGTSTTTLPGTSTPYAVSGTTQTRTVRSTSTTKRHYSKHRGNHRRRH